ncbi:MAG TPA: GNAT family N-acetyltransferase [Fimbriimonas sp.]|nr:GNAT family N-acetyltransferase [Fimbriimonas sp.]
MPVLHVGQLATDVRYQGKGIGPMLLVFAAEQAAKASKSIGCFAIELQADNEAARLFYLKHGFIELKAGSSRLYQSISTLEKAMSVRKDS